MLISTCPGRRKFAGTKRGGLCEGRYDFSLIDNLLDAVQSRNGFLGKLLVVEARQAAAKDKYTPLVAFA